MPSQFESDFPQYMRRISITMKRIKVLIDGSKYKDTFQILIHKYTTVAYNKGRLYFEREISNPFQQLTY